MTWQLRRATAADLPGIMAIESAVFASDAWSAEVMRAEIGGADSHYLVAFPPGEQDRIEGYAGLFAPRGAGEADIQTIAVAESARRQGLGRTLVLALLKEARRREVARVFLEVRADNPGAEGLYVSLGFEPISVRKRYYQPDGVDAIVMRLVIPAPQVSRAVEG